MILSTLTPEKAMMFQFKKHKIHNISMDTTTSLLTTSNDNNFLNNNNQVPLTTSLLFNKQVQRVLVVINSKINGIEDEKILASLSICLTSDLSVHLKDNIPLSDIILDAAKYNTNRKKDERLGIVLTFTNKTFISKEIQDKDNNYIGNMQLLLKVEEPSNYNSYNKIIEEFQRSINNVTNKDA